MEMAVVGKKKVPIDQDDINYLKQFPMYMPSLSSGRPNPAAPTGHVNAWVKALKLRYNDFILDSVGQDGNLKSEWKDIKEISFLGKSMTIDTGMAKLIQKLKNLGFDLRGMNSQTRESLYYGLMSPIVADQTIKRLVAADLKPNVVFTSPNQMQTKRDDIEPDTPKISKAKEEFNKQKPQIENEARQAFEGITKNTKNPNIFWWRVPEHYNQLIEKMVDKIWMVWNIPGYHYPEGRKPFLTNEAVKAMQNGLISRKRWEHLRNYKDFDLFYLLSKNLVSLNNVKVTLGASKTYEEFIEKIKDIVGDRK